MFTKKYGFSTDMTQMHEERLRDYYSVLGYALSRTENMKEAEKTMLKALTLPLHHATPERYFRDYAHAAAVFYSIHQLPGRSSQLMSRSLATGRTVQKHLGQAMGDSHVGLVL